MSSIKASPPATRKTPSKVVSPHEWKRMSVERGVVDELLLVCGVIGTTTTDGDKLVPVTDCLNWLQDLQRALRRDDDTFRPISLLLQKWKVVSQKLLPLIMTCRYDTPMVLTIVKILVILTKPLGEGTKKAGRFAIDIKKFSEQSVKEQMKLRENALAQSDMLMEFKRAMTHHSSHKSGNGNGLLSVFVSLLAEPISKTGSARTDVDHLTIELVLHLFRNLLAAEPLIMSSSDVSHSSARLHQELVCLFESELVFDILLVIAQDMESRENQNYNLLLMELLNLLTKAQDPTAVARSMKAKPYTAPSKSSKTSSKGRSSLSGTGGSLLRDALKKEKQKLRPSITTSRHSHFGGTLVVKGADGKRQYVSAALMEKTPAPPPTKKRRNRKREAFVGSTYGRAGASNTTNDPTALKAQQTIHKFCERFVADCYGPLMKSIKNEFRRDSIRLEDGDTVVFFRIVWFFCQWWRVCRKQGGLGHLIFTMDVFSHKLILTNMDSYIQHKKYPQLAQTVALYSEMLHLLYAMYGSNDSTENIMALGLMDTLFYGAEPLDKLPKLLSKWAPGTSTRDHLCDVVEVVHMTLKLLETNAAACLKDDAIDPKEKKDKQAQQKRDAVARMKANVADFDHSAYVLRKIISNPVVSMYTHLLSQYSVNAPHVNHRIMAFLIRFQKIKVAVSEDEGGDEPEELHNKLATKTVTLEPMLYNINMIIVLEEILNDKYIRKEKDFAHLLTFACRIVTNFAAQAKDNPVLFVESLFRHPVPHRFCEYTTNYYVNEELRMIAERELLLEEQRQMLDEEVDSSGEAEGDVTLHGEVTASHLSTNTSQPLLTAHKKSIDDDSDEEIEWDDADKVVAATSHTSTKRSGVILSDSESDDDEELPPKRKRVEAEKEAHTKKTKLSIAEDSSDEETEVSTLDQEKYPNLASNEKTKKQGKATFDESSDDEERLDITIHSKATPAKKRTVFDEEISSDEEASGPATQELKIHSVNELEA